MTALNDDDQTPRPDKPETNEPSSPIYTGLIDELGDPNREPFDTQ